MKLFNTLTRRKDEFVPIQPGKIGLYCCGPTVYNFAHIGNLRTFLFEDFLRRGLEFLGFDVTQVMNITDVGHLTSDSDEGEDKMEKGAKREGKTVWEIAQFYTDAFMSDMQALNILPAHHFPRATDHIAEMITQIQQIEANGLTYQSGGNVYFDTSKLNDYGKLAQLDKQALQAGARIEVDPNKKNPHDFVLWFTDSKHGNQAMQWDSPWGRGFPGWHIECSAMSMKYLGKQFDIHCGGIDHIPVHHTNEIAQAEGATGQKPWVNVWMHGEFLLIDQGKMAKSGDNFLTLQRLVEKGYHPLDYRYFCLQAHTRKELNFTWEGMDAAKNARRRLNDKVLALPDGGAIDASSLERFKAVLADDLNMPEALAMVWKLLDDSTVPDADKRATILKMDQVLGLNLGQVVAVEIPDAVRELVKQREQARADKNWALSDQLRSDIEKAGFSVKDTGDGSVITQL
ncbi:cysteine--tRNA ligase [Candidatus Peregrinibacteria bacterium]|nr:MAG: cysteine--tRNA ligase [Candidatus Peregrinibacteria bacterium]